MERGIFFYSENVNFFFLNISQIVGLILLNNFKLIKFDFFITLQLRWR